MDENLVGYLLNALDPDAHRQVETALRTDPEAQRRLDLLRRALEPLASDAEEEPPPGLWIRTLGHVAHDQVRRARPADRPSLRALPRAPGPERGAPAVRSWWRRADALVAALVMFATLTLALSVLPGLWRRQQILACQNNLRQLGLALGAYSEQHGHEFPKVDAEPPKNVAGIFAPILHDSGLLTGDVSLCCPGTRDHPTRPCPTLADLERLRHENPAEFEMVAHRLGGCYAYTLGYGTNPDEHQGLRDDDDGRLPLLADRPDFANGCLGPGNSPNHGGLGQNVLFIDGSARFCTSRTVGVNHDDIYVNLRGNVAAGRDRYDSVLGASSARPYPGDD